MCPYERVYRVPYYGRGVWWWVMRWWKSFYPEARASDSVRAPV